MEESGAWHLTDRVSHEPGKGDPFAAAVRATRMPMIVTDPRQDDNPIVFANDAFLNLTGYDRDEVMGRNCRFLQGERTDPDAVRRLHDAVDARRDIAVELLNYRKDGTLFRNALYVSPVLGADGEVQFFFASQLDVTEQVAAREALAEREAELRLIVEGASDYAIVSMDVDRRIKSWSTGAEKVLGWSADEMIGQPADAIFTPEDRAEGVPEREVDTAAGDGCANDERWHQGKNGRRVFLNGTVRPLMRDANGERQGYIKIARDETERRRTEERLRETEELNRRVLAASADCIKVLDLDGKLEFMSKGGMGIMEVDDFEDIRSACWTDFWAGEENHKATEAVAAARGGAIGRFHGFATTMKGSPRWWDVIVSPINGPDGKPEKILSISRDVTAARKADERLHQLNESLEEQVASRTGERNQLWELSLDLMLRCRFDGRILTVNPAWFEMLGWRESELVGTSLFDLIHPEDLGRTESGAEAHAEGVSFKRFENRYRHKDGSYRAISWTTRPADGVITAVGRDITAEKEAAAALEQAEDSLRQSQKMEAVGQLTGGLAHDFNNLLAGISGALELMALRIEQGRLREIDKYMVAAQGATKRAAALTHRLLAFSRRQTLLPKATDVNRLVSEMHELIQRTVGPGIAVENVGASGLWNALVDPSQLENALLNLCINARDAMPDGGRLTIETCNRWIDRQIGKQLSMPEGQYLSLCVSDTGTGMPADVIEKAFDPFFTTKPIGEGTGLGLSMIYGFAKQSGGQVRIYSEVGQGTMVCIYLPRHSGDLDIEPLPVEVVAAQAEAGETVLVVDDEPSVRLLVTDVLEELGYTSIEAGDSAAGLRVLQSDVRIDLLISDIGLPGGMNGRQMVDAGKLKRPDLKVLFITGFAENALLNGGQLGPGMAVLTKPFAIDVLAARIRELVSVKT